VENNVFDKAVNKIIIKWIAMFFLGAAILTVTNYFLLRSLFLAK